MPSERSVSWHIGLAGFSPLEWPPPGTKPGLATYAGHFNAVEINTTFYAIPSVETVRTWRRVTPPGFRFSVKMSREVTHGVPTSSGRFEPVPPGYLLRPETIERAKQLTNVARELDEKLAVLLLQFPPMFDASRQTELIAFIEHLRSPVPLAVEFRHRSWSRSSVAAALAARHVCWVASDEPAPSEVEAAGQQGAPPPGTRPLTVTSDMLYIRWLGRHGQFDHDRPQLDPSSRLKWWAVQIQAALDRRPSIGIVFGIVSHSFAADAPRTARTIMSLLDAAPQSDSGPLTLFD